MPGNKNSGGARLGTGPVRRRFTLSYRGALHVREITRSKLQRKDVTEAELNEMLEAIVQFHAQHATQTTSDTPT